MLPSLKVQQGKKAVHHRRRTEHLLYSHVQAKLDQLADAEDLERDRLARLYNERVSPRYLVGVLDPDAAYDPLLDDADPSSPGGANNSGNGRRGLPRNVLRQKDGQTVVRGGDQRQVEHAALFKNRRFNALQKSIQANPLLRTARLQHATLSSARRDGDGSSSNGGNAGLDASTGGGPMSGDCSGDDLAMGSTTASGGGIVGEQTQQPLSSRRPRAPAPPQLDVPLVRTSRAERRQQLRDIDHRGGNSPPKGRLPSPSGANNNSARKPPLPSPRQQHESSQAVAVGTPRNGAPIAVDCGDLSLCGSRAPTSPTNAAGRGKARPLKK